MNSGHLSPDQLASIAATDADDPAHVEGCPQCRAGLDEMRALVADLRALQEPPADLVEGARAYFRTRKRLEQLIERLIDDPALRTRAKARPGAVLTEAGLDPTPELVEALRETGSVSRDLAQRLAAKTFWG